MKLRLAISILCLSGFVAAPQVARADVPVTNFGLQPSTTQAGGHPDLQIAFAVKTAQKQFHEGVNSPCDCENPRFLTVHAPPGLVGNPHATPRCSAADFIALNCPADSQVGIVEVGISLSPEGELPTVSPVFNLIPRPGEPGLLGFQATSIVSVFEVFSARTGSDYGLDTKISAPAVTPPGYANQILWGVPADPSHDPLRIPKAAPPGSYLCDVEGVAAIPNRYAQDEPLSGTEAVTRICDTNGEVQTESTSSNSPLAPLIEAPTTCGVPLKSSFDVLAYDGTSSHAEASYPPTTGCDQLTFDPSLAARPTTDEADSPSGVDVELTVPQFQSPDVPSPSQIKANTIVFPPGFTINSNAADGKTACTDLQANIGTGSEDAAACPETAKIGTLEINTALLPGPLPGAMYLGRPLPGDRYRIFLVADGFDTHVKLAGTAVPDLETGRLRVTFANLPQTPFERFSVHLFGAERGSLATPTRCGTYPVTTIFTPWNDELGERTSTEYFTIDSGPDGKPCPTGQRPFEPTFQAASEGNTPAAHSTYSVDVKREDGDQFLSGLTVSPPPGFAASLNGIPYCPEEAIARLSNPLYPGLAELSGPACPPAAQIGTVTAGAGAGSRPLHVGGKVYLAGPYVGAPLSLLVVVPAVSGPYDLGNVAARAAIQVDPVTARVTTVSDPLPRIIEGIPLRTRQIRVDIDRPRFALTGTDCDPLASDATIAGDEGAVSARSAPYQLANCAGLPFEPKLGLRLRGATKRAGHPALRAVLRPRAGDANIGSASVALPHSEFLDQGHIRTICTRVQFAARECPAGAVYGHATAFTPILDEPLSGPVYLRSSSNRLPDLVMDLEGQVDFNAVGRIDQVNGGIRTTFDFIPDIPISKVVLDMEGGKKGLLQNSRNICRGRVPRAVARYTGQNGRAYRVKVPLRASCAKRRERNRTATHSRSSLLLRARKAD